MRTCWAYRVIASPLLVSGLAFLLASCGAYIKISPDSAEAFEDGLACRMPRKDVETFAKSSGMDSIGCKLQHYQGKSMQCGTSSGRAVYRLFFNEADELVTVQSGYIYDLTHLTFEDPVDICVSNADDG